MPILLAGVLLVGAAVVGGWWWLDREPDHPDEWDPRVEDLVAFVEEERGLEFEHPVYVDFLSEEDFEKEITSEESDLTEEDMEEIEQATGLMRALGLIAHDVDLLDAVNALRGGAVVGLYDHDDERIRMRGEELTPTVEATLVHELTHVLQDQHFDLEGKSEELEDSDDSSASAAWEALVEGDADRIETAWVEDLSARDKKALEKDQEKQGKGVAKKIKDVPPFLRTQLGSSYVFGEALLGLAIELSGEDAVDDLFDHPPTTEEHLLDPWTLLADDEDAEEVAEPELTDDEDEFDSGTFGAPSLLFVLAERIGVRQALVAADGWGGDQYVAFERGDRSCIRVDYLGDTRRDVAELRTALRQWIDHGPADTATVRERGKGLRFESCDPGRAATTGSGGSQEALGLAAARTALAVQVLKSGASEDEARCFSAALVRELTIEELTALRAGGDPDPALLERVDALATGCRE
ncbi:hypothetical protein [Nocardioides antri]|uniref:DUF4157 domain-containing protein n=1 Tax=Nocardioides antri TaxID=2607659 RepID=A0A5B1LY21_9ACTN|nr:hypothetical protein [Nocardioides antri]KAA1425582.1 hypothetical protein F0U47_17480 [Nocardioides antri]